MNRKLLIWGGLMVVLVAIVVVSQLRSRQEAASDLTDLNSPERMAFDECLADAAKPLNKVFVETCQKNRSIDKDPEHCTSWGSKQILKFMNEQSGYPKFKEALAAWEAASQQCSMSASHTPTPNE